METILTSIFIWIKRNILFKQIYLEMIKNTHID